MDISMDDRSGYLDNFFTKRLWRSPKQETVDLEDINDGFQARRVINNSMAFDTTERPPFRA